MGFMDRFGSTGGSSSVVDPQQSTCSNTGISISAFILSIVAVCIGIAALILSIVNSVRISRLKRKYESAVALDADDAAIEGSKKGRTENDTEKIPKASRRGWEKLLQKKAAITNDVDDSCGGKCSCSKKLSQIKAIVATTKDNRLDDSRVQTTNNDEC